MTKKIIDKIEKLYQKDQQYLPKYIFKVYTLGNWITHRVDEVMASEYDKDISDNLGLWIGIIGSVSRKLTSDDKQKIKHQNPVFLGLNLNPLNYKIIKEKSSSESKNRNFYFPGPVLLCDNLFSA